MMRQTPVLKHPGFTAVHLDAIRDLYVRGLGLQAYAAAQRYGPLHTWTGTAARVLAGRLAWVLGAPRLGTWLHVRAWRQDPDDPEARYYFARTRLERRGPLAAWYFLQQSGTLPAAPAELHADWLALHATVLGRLRDFEAADGWLARAIRTCPDKPWVYVEQAELLEVEDRYEESLQAARHALGLRPWYRPAVQAVAHALQLLDRHRQALDLLTDADQHMESGPVTLQLAVLQTELGYYHDARRSYTRALELMPLLEKDFAKWLHARRSDVVYYCGDLAEAAAIARQVGEPFYDQLAERLVDPACASQRVLLDVGFVRQHHQTCAPATLAALSRYWNMPAEHLDVAEAICYDGTPDHKERHWAETHGWTTREFTVTWESAVALLDRGVPFTLTTVEPGNAHLQAVIGYDHRRQTLLVRDPYVPTWGEFIVATMLERYRATGPRGMALVPHAEAHQLDGLDLPDAALYDHVYRLQRAMEAHQRGRAAEALAALEAAAPGHRLTLQARLLLARYDADHAKFLAAVEGLLGLFPQDGVFEMAKVACLGQLVRRDERLALLRAVCDRKDADPVFWRALAQELSADARAHGTAMRLLRRALRHRPADAPNFALLANILWDQRRFEEAMELYRFAACLDDKDEGLARSYFAATRYLKQHEATLAFLTRRFERFGRRSGQPARTLYWALSQFERLPEALAVLEKALADRPDDGELRLFAADAYAGCGDLARAEAHLAAAEGKAPPGLRLRTAANLAATRGDQKAALALWRQVLTTEPLALDAHRAAALCLAETEGRAAAQEHLRQACARFPYHVDLHQLLIGWLRDDGAAAVEPAVRALLAIHPVNAWASRELALCLSDQGRHEEALTELATARGLEPESTAYYAVSGQVYARAGQLTEARTAYREAIRRSADNEFAIGQLIDLCDTHAQRREALDFIKGELVRQVIYGDGLLAFQQHAAFTLEPEELLATLEEALAARPDLWHAWSAVVRQLLAMHRRDESLPLFAAPHLDRAAETARQAVRRFPLLPRLWFDLAEVCAARNDHAGEIEALNQARHISPRWGLVLRRLAEVHERDGRPEEARRVLEQAVAYAPLDHVNHGYLADLLWRQGDRPAALERVQLALRLEPGYEWAWEMLRRWAWQLGQPETAAEFARDLTRRRGGEARSWMMLAEVLARPEEREERLAALDRAIERNPWLTDAYNLKAEALAEAGRFDEALAACRPAAFGGAVPLYLRGRAAWVEAQRGDTETAIAQTRALVAEDPTYLWAWSNLADWYRARGETEPYLEAAGALVRLAPHRAVAFGYRGDARWRAGDRDGALEDFRRALDLDPTYGFAGIRLFDHYFAAGQYAQAGEVIDRLGQHAADDEFVTARAVRWAVHQEDLPAALAGVRRLCVAEDPSDWPLNYATEAIREYAAAAADRAPWAGQLDQLLDEALELPNAHPHVATLWVERRTARKDWACARRFDALLKRGELGRRAVYAYLRALGQARQRRRLHRFRRRHRELLRADTLAWGLVGYALSMVDEQAAAARWLADWADRSDLQAWMLINVVLALRALGREAEAAAASRRALTLPADATTAHHRLWLAVDAALAGETEAAAKHGDGIDPQTCDASHRFLHALVGGLLAVQRAAPRDRPEALRRVRRRLRAAAAACTPMPEDRRAILRTYRRCVLRLGRDGGTIGALLWACWRWLEPRIPAASGSATPTADESGS